MSTLHPTQIGTIPSGFIQTIPSQVVIGRDVSIENPSYEAFGFGIGGRPDFIEKVVINLTKNTSADKTQNGTLTKFATASINVEDLITIVNSNSNASSALSFTLKEVDVCDNGVAKKMIVLASDTYLP